MSELDAVRRPLTALGFITPSGNVVVERVATALLRDLPEVSGHFSRSEVTGSTDAYAEDYHWAGMLEAARLLSHAAPGAICWNGSKGGSIGFDRDVELCERIEVATGVRAITSTLAIQAAMRWLGVVRIGLVTPYTAAYGSKIAPHFAAAGLNVVAAGHAGVSDNLAYASVPDATILELARHVAEAKPEVVITYCTNFPAAHLVPDLEAELGVPVFDSVSAGVWGALRVAGVDTMPAAGWGQLFEMSVAL